MSKTIISSQEVLGKNFAVYGDVNEPLFLARDVAEMIEHSDVSKMVKAVDDDEKVKNNVLTPGGLQETWFLTEYGLYEVLMQSRKQVAKDFKKEVKQILRDLRRTGAVITEGASDESIDYQSKYGRYRLRKTFTESSDMIATYREYKALSKIERDAKRIDNRDRIRNCNIVLDVIETTIAENATTMKGSEMLALRELALEVQADITHLHNKLNGGKKSAMTKRIQQLEEELAMTQEVSEDDFYFIDSHPFSENYMYTYGKGKVVKTAAYHRWINNLHLEDYLPETYPGVDFTQPIRMTILLGHKDNMDTINFSKSIIDQLSIYYGFNDKLVVECIESLHSYVEDYNDGYIYVKIENICDTNKD